MKKNRKNRILAFVLAAIMIVGMFPASAFAENQETDVQQISEENNAPDSVHEEEKTTTGDQAESQNPSEEQPKKTKVIKRKVWKVMIIDGEEVMVEEEIEEVVEVDDEDEPGEEQKEEQTDKKNEETLSENTENQQTGVTNETTAPVSISRLPVTLPPSETYR